MPVEPRWGNASEGGSPTSVERSASGSEAVERVQSRKVRSMLERLGCRSFSRALVSS